MISAVPFSITFATPVGSQLVNGSSAQLCATADYEEAMALADRILVVHDGAVEQIGTPEEVYRRPATTFTAAITGSPPMNLYPMHGAGWCRGRWQSRLSSFRNARRGGRGREA
ncbi:MAG: hypothetical protein HYU65_04395 [Armatimonadetes bacterium]|nr:hypothetical protein [Armatimonadota bacterium]